jgi:hypothetical protein
MTNGNVCWVDSIFYQIGMIVRQINLKIIEQKALAFARDWIEAISLCGHILGRNILPIHTQTIPSTTRQSLIKHAALGMRAPVFFSR